MNGYFAIGGSSFGNFFDGGELPAGGTVTVGDTVVVGAVLGATFTVGAVLGATGVAGVTGAAGATGVEGVTGAVTCACAAMVTRAPLAEARAIPEANINLRDCKYMWCFSNAKDVGPWIWAQSDDRPPIPGNVRWSAIGTRP